ncbi:hypothetical protein LIER_13604 [Lithospermum erythrorhizon]|uniref:Uncharacterized protein n=1 Tax=Lithospermum erythrorhizon TaxID=34254 RepID=A0AAV3PY20_LITER
MLTDQETRGCWEIHGKPPNWTPRKPFEKRGSQGDHRGEGGGGSYQGKNFANAVAVPPGQPPLSKKQLEQIYAVLQQQPHKNFITDGASCFVAKSGNLKPI